jgi:hypothetical protein
MFNSVKLSVGNEANMVDTTMFSDFGQCKQEAVGWDLKVCVVDCEMNVATTGMTRI